MSASLVGSEMCIRDRWVAARANEGGPRTPAPLKHFSSSSFARRFVLGHQGLHLKGVAKLEEGHRHGFVVRAALVADLLHVLADVARLGAHGQRACCAPLLTGPLV
eukprot:11234811-Alexandrium_andersonii.AAC.1